MCIFVCHRSACQFPFPYLFFPHQVELASGLLVTPWHPIRVENTWCFPAEIQLPRTRKCPAVYSYVLSRHHVAIIDGVE